MGLDRRTTRVVGRITNDEVGIADVMGQEIEPKEPMTACGHSRRQCS